ncbi:MAG: cupin domain-containing protein [Candidatus Latescibacterota bacterium]
MALQVFDYHTDIRNVFVTPQIRSRFLRMEPGTVAERHSHDLGHEIFLILEGNARFEISGEIAELGPGQMCVARIDEPHQVSVIGDEPMTMYLSVTPHIQPTHTGLDDDDERKPIRFMPSSSYDQDESSIPIEESIDHFVDFAESLVSITQTAAEEQRMAGVRLSRALGARNEEAADRQREIMWFGVYRIFDKLFEMAEQWNKMSPRAGSTR